ncbi:hypothetical protein [Thalassotalea sp. PS06]|uniref:hypothetical protein n=1 Tax=Thalassotalea sp. PS06 TaxID=2594005 RepID=UPI0011644C75|nr:hypothetical protein [Thalassotalea sp. PS06]QDP01031.1 hypothetical protein FNC98_06530 [Thalassotalea sp. PS06]
MKIRRLLRPISANIKDEREVIFLEVVIAFICGGFAFIARDAQLTLLFYPMLILVVCCLLSALYHIVLLFLFNRPNSDDD